ncbi:MAG TPA: type II toxin-antitoxin system ParD family antitoxin [Bryobacteraceae bacterium]|jgi:antitoxin ParD1/3/4|nr:type II toxin-antitoxin system ParD family antitoxin [Bryobacteraceae bacterium]
MNVSLPETMKEFVDEQVQSGGYGSASEYIRDLVRRDQKERTEARLETLLLDGLNSGEDIPLTPEFWEKLRTDLSARRAKKKSG